MIWLTCFMIFARCVDMFWLIEPNFKDAARNLVGEPIGILAYITVPAAVLAAVGGVLHNPVDEAAAAGRERSAPGRDSGA